MTVEEPTLFDAAAGQRLADEGIERADRGVTDEWRVQADQIIAGLAASGRPFLPDDVWKAGLPRVRENRALGARMKAASRIGLIVPTGRYVETEQAASHRRPIREWRGANMSDLGIVTSP